MSDKDTGNVMLMTMIFALAATAKVDIKEFAQNFAEHVDGPTRTFMAEFMAEATRLKLLKK